MTFFVTWAASGPVETGLRVEPERAVLQLVHDGRFDEAEEIADRAVRDRPEDPAPAFFRAVVAYWRLVYDDENADLALALEANLERAAAIGEAALARGRTPNDAAVWAGSSRLLLARLRASQRRPLQAAREARRAKVLLEEALATSPAAVEPYFGLGTYNYYADRVSAIVKGLRVILRLPGGDRARGLEQLGLAARRSAYFGLESRLLLATIYSSRHERLYINALHEMDRALALAPNAITALHGAARLELSLGRPERAAMHLDRALERAAEAPRTARSVLASLQFQRARADFALFRPDRAVDRLRPLLASARGLPTEIEREARGLLAVSSELLRGWPTQPGGDRARDADGEAAGRSWSEIAAALDLEERAGAEAAAQAMLKLARGAGPSLWLLAGRALLRAGRGEQALAWLERADASRQLPDVWTGPCRLLAGQAADLAGDRERAQEHYRKSLKAPPFLDSDAAHMHLDVPYPIRP